PSPGFAPQALSSIPGYSRTNAAFNLITEGPVNPAIAGAAPVGSYVGGPPVVPVTFVAQVTRNRAPIPGATATIQRLGGPIPMPPTDANGFTQATVELPVGPNGLAGSHLTVSYGGQVADTDAYLRY